jgi:hypothetical protein
MARTYSVASTSYLYTSSKIAILTSVFVLHMIPPRDPVRDLLQVVIESQYVHHHHHHHHSYPRPYRTLGQILQP